MAQRVNLDAMIPRADFAIEESTYDLDLFNNFSINYLNNDNSVLKLLRKPDFQRETNHWTPSQVISFLMSFLDNELIPSLILWKSESYIFIIDGGHRLSALRAWINDDYGDGVISLKFYSGEISKEQKSIAQRTRRIIDKDIGRFSSLKQIVDTEAPSEPLMKRRAGRLFTRALNLQWVQGSAAVAESSFFKINSQGTRLDDTEEFLLRNRKKCFAIAARAVVRAGSGHKYWSYFASEMQAKVESDAFRLYKLLFEPETDQPVKTLDLPLGGSSSPVDALSLIIELLMLVDGDPSAPGREERKESDYKDDLNGEETLQILRQCTKIIGRITSNTHGSLGLHPAVYFYNERGKHSRFLFLGVVHLINKSIRSNNKVFFKKFTAARSVIEDFLLKNKALLGIVLQNTNKKKRVERMSDMLAYCVQEVANGQTPSVEKALSAVGARGRIFEITAEQPAQSFSEETKSEIFIKTAIQQALKCPICGGLIDPSKSISYDHILPLKSGGFSDSSNGQMVHPYCNTAVKN